MDPNIYFKTVYQLYSLSLLYSGGARKPIIYFKIFLKSMNPNIYFKTVYQLYFSINIRLVYGAV